jgi:hypothetical protein
VRVLVCGSRDWSDKAAIWRSLSALPGEHEPVVIVHGAASRKVRGVEQSADMLAAAVARELGFSVDPFPANWSHYGKAAGFIRNLAMLDTQPDRVFAFQRNGSRGTQHTIDEARKRGIPVDVISA